MASYSQPGSDTKLVTTGLSIKYLLRDQSLLRTSKEEFLLTGRQNLDHRREIPGVLNIIQSWAETAQQFITNTPISCIRAVMTQGCGDMLLAWDKKWWWITWLLTGSSSSVEVRLDGFISGVAEADIIQWPNAGSHGTDWDSSRRRTRYQTLHPWDRLRQHLAKSTSQVSTMKVLARQFGRKI